MSFVKRIPILLLILAFGTISGNATNKDSLLTIVEANKTDTGVVNALNLLFSSELNKDINLAIDYSKKAYYRAKDAGYEKGLAASLNNWGLALYRQGENQKALEKQLESVALFKKLNEFEKLSITLANIGNIFFSQSNYLKAVDYYKQSLEFAAKTNDKKRIAGLHGNIGIIYYYQGMYSESLSAYMKSLSIREQIDDLKGIANIYNNIGAIYDEQEQYRKSIEQYGKSLEIRKSLKDSIGIVSGYVNIGVAYNKLDNKQEALDNFKKSLTYAQKIDYKQGLVSAYNNMGDIYVTQENYNEATHFFNLALEINKELTDNKNTAVTLINLGNIQKNKQDYKQALKFYLKSLNICEKEKFNELLNRNYKNIAEMYAEINNFPKAYKYFKKYAVFSDSLKNNESIKQLANMQVKYETEQKEKEIQLLTKDKQYQDLKLKEQQNAFYYLILVVGLLFVILYIGFRSYRQKQFTKQLLLQQETEKIKRNTEKQMMSKVIETEESERKRFAKDLHDGLGPLLSSIKLYVNELNIPDEEKDMLKYTNELIDDAVQNTRSIANNLMPSVLEDYGLIEAVRKFSDKITLAGSTSIIINTQGNFDNLNKTIEIALYRVILELINNSLKHAEASKITIDFKQEAGKMIVEYADNGKGCDVDGILNSDKKGLGLTNIQNRIQTLSGKCEYKSKINQGFNASVCFPI